MKPNSTSGFQIHNFYFFSHTLTFISQFFFFFFSYPLPTYPLSVGFPCLHLSLILFPFIIFSSFLWDLYLFILSLVFLLLSLFLFYSLFCVPLFKVFEISLFFSHFNFYFVSLFEVFVISLFFFISFFLFCLCIYILSVVCETVEEEDKSNKKGRRDTKRKSNMKSKQKGSR